MALIETRKEISKLSSEGGLKACSPADGALLATLQQDSSDSLNHKINAAEIAQKNWYETDIQKRAELIKNFASAVETQLEFLTEVIMLDAGKTRQEAENEVKGFINVLRKTVDLVLNKKYDDLNSVKRSKLRMPAGVVGLITSYNFPLAVAGWSFAPALLAGNSLIWKPSEKTLVVAIFIKRIFEDIADKMNIPAEIFDILIGGREVGEQLVKHESINMVSATGSLAMGKAVTKALDNKKTNKAPPLLELGGNNGVVISKNLKHENIIKSVEALLTSFLAGGGQKCTNTRRVFVHKDIYDEVVTLIKDRLTKFIAEGNIKSPLDEGVSSKYGYSALIDEDAHNRFQYSIDQARKEGGELAFGGTRKLLGDNNTYYVEPAIMLMPGQTPIMFEECFAPLLYIIKYDDFAQALEMVNAPANAGLVNGIYTENKSERDLFISHNKAGHSVINSSTGTGTPAHGLGFGGNKESGRGRILNEDDLLAPFTVSTNAVAEDTKLFRVDN